MRRGQSLIEVIVALGIGVLIIATATGATFTILRSNQLSQNNQVTFSLISSLADNLISLAESDWRDIYDLNKGPSNKYHVATSTGILTPQSNEEELIING